MVRRTFSPARAWRPAVVARLARTLGPRSTTASHALMYFGTSALLDFAVCAGLGIAAGSCLVTAICLVRGADRLPLPKGAHPAVGLVSFLLFGGSLLSIAAVLGETKTARDAESIWGFVLGVVLLVPILWLTLRAGADPRNLPAKE